MSETKFVEGQRFGRLVLTEPTQDGCAWVCACDCGSRVTVTERRLKCGRKSCNCIKRENLARMRAGQKERARAHVLQNYIPEPNSGCWLWLGATQTRGYGLVRRGLFGTKSTHRIFWMAHRGSVPDGLFVLHKCDTRLCVNPDHLFLGTAGDNARDMAAKGRWNNGRYSGPRCASRAA